MKKELQLIENDHASRMKEILDEMLGRFSNGSLCIKHSILKLTPRLDSSFISLQ